MEKQVTNQNKLISETSPYLLQHAHNPVDWYPWGDEALEKAQNENKLLIVSIGYSACHWCHVMERESFEEVEVADIMNEHFISIKVDREERPDIDQIYMNAIHLLSGQGGWPLNCIALPDGTPVYGGTYFQKHQWIHVLESLQQLWQNEPQKLFNQAEQLKHGINETDLIIEPKEKSAFIKEDLLNTVNQWKHRFDSLNGGDDGAPKFPMPDSHLFLMHYAALANDEDSWQHVMLSLKKMAGGGIYDHVRGGFARYSVDAKWFVPHFEKMLYDNAQLVSLYSNAYQATRNEQFKQVVYDTLAFVKRELTSPEGGFYSAIDADSEGEEGKYYVWSKQEVDQLLGPDSQIFCAYYGIIEPGNWENGKNIPFIDASVPELAKKYNKTETEIIEIVSEGRKKLFHKQSDRVRPLLDDKILTSWNALMLRGYLDAYTVFGEDDFLEMALKNGAFIKNHLLKPDFRLDRTFKKGTSKINAFLDDYSFSIDAFTRLYQMTFDEQWYHLVNDLFKYTDAHFYDENSEMYYYTSTKDRKLVARKMELSDNVIASSNSSMAKNLFQNGIMSENKNYQLRSEQMLTNVLDQVYKYPKYYSNWALLLLWQSFPFHEVVFSGDEALNLQKEWHRHFIPNHLTVGSAQESNLPLLKNRFKPGENLIYVCVNNTCQRPVSTVNEALTQVNQVV